MILQAAKKFFTGKSSEEPHFPWYDSPWLTSYVRSRNFLEQHYPEKLQGFEDQLRVFRTDTAFKSKTLPSVLDPAMIDEIRELIKTFQTKTLDNSEFSTMGRNVVEGFPYFNNLQNNLTELVSDSVGEELEPSYNFLSLYQNTGRSS